MTRKLPSVYAGIGSRRTPNSVLDRMASLAKIYAREGVVLRSGHAPGADQAFEYGAKQGGGTCEIYLPWEKFENGHEDPALVRPTMKAMEIAAEFHPRWKWLKRPTQRLIARNTHQVLGVDCATPVDLVICWTPDGSLDGQGEDSGGTGQALRIAKAHGISVVNLKDEFMIGCIDEQIEDSEKISFPSP